MVCRMIFYGTLSRLGRPSRRALLDQYVGWTRKREGRSHPSSVMETTRVSDEGRYEYKLWIEWLLPAACERLSGSDEGDPTDSASPLRGGDHGRCRRKHQLGYRRARADHAVRGLVQSEGVKWWLSAKHEGQLRGCEHRRECVCSV